MTAYTGAIMRRFGESFAVDLSGITWSDRPLPILLEHNPTVRLAVASVASREDGPLILEGTFLQNAAAKEIIGDADAGFPFQASIGIEGEVIEDVGVGAKSEVNGQEFVGPGTIMRKGVLREVSFCALGLDSSTSAEALSRRGSMDPKKGEAGSTAPGAPAAVDGAQKIKDRLAKLKRAAVLPRQAELVLKLAAEDTSLEDALMELMEDLKAASSAIEAKVQESIDAKSGEKKEEPAPAPAAEQSSPTSNQAATAEIMALLAHLRGPSTQPGATAPAAAAPSTGTPASLKAAWDACPEGTGIKDEFSSFETFSAFSKAQAAGNVNIFVQEPKEA
jgi:hypothetical protein